jgi:hypothetical protein
MLRAGIDSADPGPFSYEETNWTHSSHEWWGAWGGRGNGGKGGRAPNDEQQPPDAEDPASLPEALRSEPKHYHHWLPRGAEVSKRPKFTHQRDKLQEAGRFLKVPWPDVMRKCFPQKGLDGSRGSQLFLCLTKRQSMVGGILNQLESKTNMQVRQLRGDVRRVGGGADMQSPWKQDTKVARRWTFWVETEQTNTAVPLHFHYDGRELG